MRNCSMCRACLGGLRSLKMPLAVPKPGVGLHLCFRAGRLGDVKKLF